MNLKLLSNRQIPGIPKTIILPYVLLALLGFADASYLTISHYQGKIPPCSLVNGCEKVLTSGYATILGIPTALFGAIFYLTLFVLVLLYLDSKKTWTIGLCVYLSFIGFLVSLILLYLQVFVIGALCFYCLVSGFINLLLSAHSSWLFYTLQHRNFFEPSTPKF